MSKPQMSAEAESKAKLIAKIKKSLPRSKRQAIHITKDLLEDIDSEKVIYSFYSTRSSGQQKINLLGYVKTFKQMCHVATELAFHIQHKDLLSARIYFNSINVSDIAKDFFDDNNISRFLSFNEAIKISEYMFESDITENVLARISFDQLKATTLSTAKELVGYNSSKVVLNISKKEDVADPVVEIQTFIKDNEAYLSTNRSDSIIAAATRLAFCYYKSESATRWLINKFGKKAIFSISGFDGTAEVLRSIETHLEENLFGTLETSNAMWFMERSGSTKKLIIRENNLSNLTKEYVDFFLENNYENELSGSNHPLFLDAIKGMTVGKKAKYHLRADSPHININIINEALIDYLLTKHTNKTSPIDEIQADIIKEVKKIPELKMPSNKKEANKKIEDIRNIFLKHGSMSSTAPDEYFHPYRMAVIMLESKDESHQCMAKMLLSNISTKDIAERLVSEKDVLSLLNNTSRDPYDIILNLKSEELKAAALNHITN